MNRTINILLFLLILNGPVWAQKERQKEFESEFGTLITMSDSAFVVLSYQKDYPTQIKWRICDTIAICSWETVSKDIIRIDSKNPYELVRESSSIILKDNTYIDTDSLFISFVLPVETTPVEIRLCQLMENNILFEREIHYPKTKTIKVPNRITSVFINTKQSLMDKKEPTSFLEVEPPYSRPFFLFPFFVLNNVDTYNSKEIEISIPVMNDAFFERLWIKGEYIQICEKGLLWHGVLFYKTHDSESIFKMPGNSVIGPRPSIIQLKHYKLY